MFLGRHKAWISAQAQIRSTRWTQGKSQYVGPGPETTHSQTTTAEVIVKPEGAPEFQATISTDKPGLSNGGETYVLYDPEHPERCEIDFDRLRKEFKHQGGAGLAAFPGWRLDDLRAEGLAADGADASPPAAVVNGGEDLPTQLAKLGDLHTNGGLTDEEFAAAKARLLGQQA